MNGKDEAANIDDYIKDYPKEVRDIMEKIRKTIKEVMPDATETIGYGIPTFKLNGKNVVHFGGYDKHIGFYPAPGGLDEFEEELAQYRKGKGTAQFQLDEPIPYGLIKKITQFRAMQVLEKTK